MSSSARAGLSLKPECPRLGEDSQENGFSLSQLSLQKPGPTIKQAVLIPCPASCQRENCSFRGQIVYEERQSVASGDQIKSKSSGSRCQAGPREDELACSNLLHLKPASPRCTRPGVTVSIETLGRSSRMTSRSRGHRAGT